MTVNIIVFEGDGIGPEIMRSTLEIIDLLNTKMEIDIKIEKGCLLYTSPSPRDS